MEIDEKVLKAFYNIVSESKQELYDKIAAQRTRHVTVILENIQKDHNASAILRTCDCFGIQDLHTAEVSQEYTIQREIARGAGSWVDIHSYTSKNPVIECTNKLKKDGYKIIATSPHAEKSIYDIDLEQPIAFLFGTEWTGISDTAIEQADELVQIPMYGFTESFNVSVSAALLLNAIRRRLEESNIVWKLSESEQIALKIDWCTKILRDGVLVEQEIRQRILEKE